MNVTFPGTIITSSHNTTGLLLVVKVGFTLTAQSETTLNLLP